MADSTVSIQLNPLLRVAGQTPATADIVHQAIPPGTEHIRVAASPADSRAHSDPILVDLTLHVDNTPGPVPSPQPGVAYAGLTPRQRYRFLAWASRDPAQPAPEAYQQLYCAHLELALLDTGERAQQARDELPRLAQAEAWHQSPALARTQLLAFWLDQDGAGLAAWLGLNLVPAELLGVAAGCQALLGQPLDAREALTLAQNWSVLGGQRLSNPQAQPDTDVLRLHLSSLEASLGARLLDHALDQMPQTAREPQPWRANHRALRLAFPQPDLRRPLIPLLRDLFSLPTGADGPAAHPDTNTPSPTAAPTLAEEPTLPERGWQLILEFGNSRSEYFDIVMHAAQKLPGYTQLMDENRQLVHRVVFKRSELRRFWRIWDLVQTWSSTRVYVNGEELEKWKIWPYSQYLQQ